ncbi:MAG: cell wall-binding repeat-containing protein [Desulfosporosinus sp.]|nr:cell wall-binding repeat-containing protein [Desulfosporosinus sp.]
MDKTKVKKVLVTLALSGLAITRLPFNVFADNSVTTARLSGSDRVGTAIAVADAGWTSATTAILASSSDANLVDALAAAPLAGKQTPILLTDNNSLPDVTRTELLKLGVKTVYVVGAISQNVVNQVKAIGGLHVVPLKGADRIATAVMISSHLTNPAGSFVVGYGALADALSVASYAAANNYSILVANPDGSLPASEAVYKGANVYIIGGPSLVADISNATRIFGADRFATNQKVLQSLTYKYDKVYVANGNDAHLVDSLVASSLVAKTNAPIVLSDTATVLAATDVHAKLTNVSVITALGGTSLVPDSNVTEVIGTDTTNPTPPTPPIIPSALSITGKMIGVGASNSLNATTLTNPVLSSPRNIILIATDSNGTPVANQTIYLGPNLQGLWITQVNGVALTGHVNMGTTDTTLMQMANTPVPLSPTAYTNLAYDTVSAPGILANTLKTTPVIALQTGATGTVSLTLEDGTVPYVSVPTSATTFANYVVDTGKSITAKSLNLYSDSAETAQIGTMPVDWGNSTGPNTSNDPPNTVYPVTGITLNSSTVALTAGGTLYPLVSTIAPSNATNTQVNWSTSNASIATVSSSGVVTPVGAGTATITVTSESGVFTASSVVTVAPATTVKVTGVTLDKSTLNLIKGGTQTLTATLTPITATNKLVVWSTSNPGIATVTQSGVVTAVGIGPVVITATSVNGGYTASSSINVYAFSIPVTGLALNKSSLSLKAGGAAETLIATILPSDATNTQVVWRISDPTIATMSNGTIKPLRAGTTTVTATAVDGGSSAPCYITVTQ